MKNLLLLLLLACLLSQCKNGNGDSVPAPVITSVNISYGIVGDPVIVNGSNLGNATSITFSGKSSTIISNTATQLTTVVPPAATPGKNDIVVNTAGGSSNKLSFDVLRIPDVVDSLPPTIEKTIPEQNFSQYPVLLFGDQLSGVMRVSFNDISAEIYTNNRNVVTVTVPDGLPTGNVQIKVITAKGTATKNFHVQGPPPGGPPNLNFSIVDIPPPTYVPSISNNWSCGLFSAQTDSTFVELNSDPEFDDTFLINGQMAFDYENNYNSRNYVEFTNEVTGETFAGHFSASSDNPCILKMVLISSVTGTVTECTFDRRVNDATLDCDE